MHISEGNAAERFYPSFQNYNAAARARDDCFADGLVAIRAEIERRNRMVAGWDAL